MSKDPDAFWSLRRFNNVSLAIIAACISLVYILAVYVIANNKPYGAQSLDTGPATAIALASAFVFVVCEGLVSSQVRGLAVLIAIAGLLGLLTVALGINYDETEDPNIPLPPGLSNVLGRIPWSAHDPRTRRHHLECRLHNCKRGSAAYVVEAPVDTEVLYMSSQEMMRTGYATTYPVATVFVVPKRFQNLTYILDYVNGQGNSQTLGIRPMIRSNNALLNMGSTWATHASTASEGLNVTGNFKHSFVIVNESDHVVYFAKNALQHAMPEAPLDFWSLEPGTKTLMWPSATYFNNTGPMLWNASKLKPELHYDQAASLAETLMFDILAPTSPVV